ncbi:MAG: HEAT repeat domain-containing protein, partial [Gemmatimonadota bacterium]
FLRTGLLLLLALVFTAGLTFATVELPRLLDGFLQNTVSTPGGDSHADTAARLRTELFMAHYHVRTVGYVAFFLLLALIAAGFATGRTGLAALGAVGVMLPVFAQFASVMFFLAGLGLLNAIWLPVLDVSWRLQDLGQVIDAPADAIGWLLGRAGIQPFWPTSLLFIAGGLLVFLLGTYAWLSARARGRAVADSLVYRWSRHPQYLGWILWTYGAYLLLRRMQYPRRSWGIGASLPWLISTLVIIGVALIEELNMRRRYGTEYETYRRRAPFLLPLPRIVTRLLSLPSRLLFRTERPERKREVVAVLAVWGVLMVATSAVLQAGGVRGALLRFAPPERRAAAAREVIDHAMEAEGRRRYLLLTRAVPHGEAAVGPLVELLQGGDVATRVYAAEVLEQLRSEASVPALCAALSDPEENVRYRSSLALGAIAAPSSIACQLPLLDDPANHIRLVVLGNLAALSDERILDRVPEFLSAAEPWTRSGGLSALAALGSERGVPLVAAHLEDEAVPVRRDAVIALLRIGSPAARPALERAVADPDREVRIYATEALKRLPAR